MTTGTSGILPVLVQTIAHRLCGGARLAVQVRVYAGWGRRNGQAENIIQKPFAAQYRRRPVRVRGGCQQRSFPKQTPTLVSIRESDSAEAAPVDAFDSVLPRQPLVQERVVCAQKFPDGPIVLQRAGHKKFR